MIYTKKEVDHIRGYRVDIGVTDEMLSTAQNVASLMSELYSRMRHQLTESVVLRIDTSDIEIYESKRYPHRCITVYEAKWAPKSHFVKLIGGPWHDKTVSFPGAPDSPLLIAEQKKPSVVSDYDEVKIDLSDKVRYEMNGWDNEKRTWIYEPIGTD